MLNLKNHWVGYLVSFQKAAIAFCVMVALVGTLFAPVFTQPAIAAVSAAQVAASAETLQVLSDRFDRLEKFVYTSNWNDVITYIHGPFGEIRRELRSIASQLGKTEKDKANDLANELFKNFVKLDNAAKDKNAIAAETAFKEALQNFESIIELAI